jgi:predicted nucleic acid-binding protein
MTALVFVDTNVLVYARDPRNPQKQSVAREWIRLLWDENRGRMSAQVLSEFYDVVTRKLRPKVSHDDAWEEVQSYLSWNPQPIDTEVLTRARELERRHRLSWWDCQIVAAAQVQGCSLLLTEDLQDKANYGGVAVRNPFTLGVSEEHTAYAALPKIPSRHRGRGRPRKRPHRTASAAS